jgi:lysozyme family protein
MINNWDKSFELVMTSEGGFSDDPRDKGNHMPDGRPGCTNWGVTMITYEMYVGRQATIEEMKALTKADVKPLYKKLFWDKCWCDKLPSGIDYLIFDFAVNAGRGMAIILLQRAVGSKEDGGMGPNTYAATLMYNPKELIDKYSQAKTDFYISLANPIYEQGWLNRVAHVKIAATQMLG